MSMPDPQHHLDLVARMEQRLDQENRLRAVEVEQASTRAVLAELPRMETRLSVQIAELKAKSPWPTVMAILGVVSLVLMAVGMVASR